MTLEFGTLPLPAVPLTAWSWIVAALLCVGGVWTVLRVRASHTAQQRALTELHALRALFEGLELRTREAAQHAAAEALRLREDLLSRSEDLRVAVTRELGEQRLTLTARLASASAQTQETLGNQQVAFESHRTAFMQVLHETTQRGFQTLHGQLDLVLRRHAEELARQVSTLTETTEARLRDIGGLVDRRLAEGFERTTATFTDVLQRLAVIDEAQRKIAALSGEVVGLQQILADKRSRGAFGEVQLAALLRNVLPEAAFSLQHTLPNGRIADCVLFLPPPTGMLAIDAKFPLEAFRRMSDTAVGEFERRQAERQFKADIRKHVRDIANRYILPSVTAEGAVMFIPAEAVFAEIQARHADLVDEAHAARVWLVSPTTLWAVLTTASAVLKDAATREQVDIIREHLGLLGKDFQRFRERMEQLARHIEQAHEDVRRVNVSARRITDRFERIERVELEAPPSPALETSVNSAEEEN
ncbi:MAG: DNA recombination protein RmuC [Gammaproteobacteria bacterium]